MRAVVVGASSGLGRCIAIGLGQRGEHVALLARRRDRLDRAAAEAGPDAIAIECDVTDPSSIDTAIAKAAAELGGIDGIVYSPAVGPLKMIADVDGDTWARVFETNVTGASLVTAAALPHLAAAGGTAVYLSSVSAMHSTPMAGLGAYVVSKAALDKLIDVWRSEYPGIGFTRCVIGDCAGGDGESLTGFADDWDWDLAGLLHTSWDAHGHLIGSLLDVEQVVDSVHFVLQAGSQVSMPTIVVAPRPPSGDEQGGS